MSPHRLRHFVPVLLGTIFEYYDVALFGFLAIPFSKTFFNATDPTVALLEAYAIFAISSCAKPLGALFFSHIGDKYGRKVALSHNLIGVGIPTLLIAGLPGYETLGILAPIFLLFFRFSQNFFLGGEFDGVSLYVFEHGSKKYPCFLSSILFLCVSLGTFLASSVVTLTALDFLQPWGWRLAFLGGSLLSFAIVYLRSSLKETPVFLEKKPHEKKLPWRVIFKTNFPALLSTFLILGSVGGLNQFCFFFLGAHLTENLGFFPFFITSQATSLCLFLYTVGLPLGGLLGDVFGAHRVFKYAAWGTFFLTASCLSFFFLTQGLFFVFGAFGLLFGILSPPIYVVVMSLFPTEARYRGLSIGHALGNLIFAKNTPFFAQALFQQTALPFAPLFYFLFLAGMTLLGLLFESFIPKRESHDTSSRKLER